MNKHDHFLRIDDCGSIICYPKFDEAEFQKRREELESLGIIGIESKGRTSIGEFKVLGKGYVGIVVSALKRNFGRVALKIRRVDADREDLNYESSMLKLANSVNVGPKLYSNTDNFIVMEFIEGLLIGDWLLKLELPEESFRVKQVIIEILEQCYRLDMIGLDHGELSNARKHIIIDNFDKPTILDFETASTVRKTSNVTSICSFLFIKSPISHLIASSIGEIDKHSLLRALNKYKRVKDKESFTYILKNVLKLSS